MLEPVSYTHLDVYKRQRRDFPYWQTTSRDRLFPRSHLKSGIRRGYGQNLGNPAYFTSTWAEYQGYSYYFGADGYLVTGWNYINNHWYRFNPEKGSHEGAMMTGWIFDPDYNGWFYTNPSGILVTGWNKIGGEWYYFNPDSDGTMGLMAVNQVIDGYYVNSDGKMNEP